MTYVSTCAYHHTHTYSGLPEHINLAWIASDAYIYVLSCFFPPNSLMVDLTINVIVYSIEIFLANSVPYFLE